MEPVVSDIARQIEALKVLIVDDEQTMRKVTRSLLQAIGVRNIQEANDGRSGLEAICRLTPDIVILDWEMPGPNGPEFMRAVRSPSSFPQPDVPVIMLTPPMANGRGCLKRCAWASTNFCSNRFPRRRCSRAWSRSSASRAGQ
jgi:two-component system, chemotaxis family, chemotaxis protein CheY